MKRSLLLALLIVPAALMAGSAIAQIYRTTDEQGNVVFTDRPPAAGSEQEEVQLNRTNTAPPPPDIPRHEPEPTQAEEAKEPEALSYGVSITFPTNETTIPMGPGNFSVSAAVEPALEEGNTVQLYLDGTPWGEPQAVPAWNLTNVFRGAHDLTVAVLNADGQLLVESEPIRVYVMRPSSNFRR